MQRYEVKIGLSNAGSIALFKQLGFCEVSTSSVFQEVTLACEGQALQRLLQLAAQCPAQERTYDQGGAAL